MSKLDDLMGRKMTRRQFLITLGAGFVGLFGLSSLMGLLSQNEPDKEPPDYGMLNYGP